MTNIYDIAPEQTEKKKYRGESEGTDEDKAAVGGEKTLSIQNILFQSDADAQDVADTLLARLKERKKYYEIPVEFCPVPIERGDTVAVEEYIKHDKSVWHNETRVRQIKIDIALKRQTMTMIVEDIS